MGRVTDSLSPLLAPTPPHTSQDLASSPFSSYLPDGADDVSPGSAELGADLLHGKHLSLQLPQPALEVLAYPLHLPSRRLKAR